MHVTDTVSMVNVIPETNQSTADSIGLCANRSLSADNDSRTSTGCRLDDEWRWFDGNNELKELFKNITLGVVLVAACLLTIVGNALVLHAVRTERKLQTVCKPLKTNYRLCTKSANLPQCV